MSKKVGRNDPCPCGSGKKYKNCHMLQEQETTAAKYTPSGKRKFKARVLTAHDRSLSVFSSATTAPAPTPAPDVLEKLKYRMTKGDFRTEEQPEHELPFELPSRETTDVVPQERERHLPKPGEEFQATTEDFTEKKE